VALGKGQSQQFTADTTGSGTLSWSVSDADTSDPVSSLIPGTGLLTVDPGEAAGALIVKADYGSASGQAVVWIIGNEVLPESNGINVSPQTIALAPGESQTFTAAPSEGGEALVNVTWSVEVKPDYVISSDGTLTVAPDETADTLTVEATDGEQRYGRALVTVLVDGGKPIPANIGVRVEPQTGSAKRGLSKLFKAYNSSGGEITGNLSWEVFGKTVAGTGINENGLLYVAGDEAAEYLTVKAKTGNAYGTAVVKVSDTALVAAEKSPNIKEKFGITESGTVGVENAFLALSAYIKGSEFDGANNVIKLGDYIDLESGLTVAAHSDHGGFSISADEGVTPITTGPNATDNPNYRGALLRLIVVGINSFNSINGNDTTPHVVFQFQNIPVLRRMNSWNTSANGYGGSELRTYILNNFLTGLKGAGVPEAVLWAPARVISKSDSDTDTLTDTLWLPTEREILGSGSYSVSAETAENQARLEYYDSVARRIKYSLGVDGYPNIVDPGSGRWYWNASIRNSQEFCHFGHAGNPYLSGAGSDGGVVPAFCVK
jgi:hypothetical protein